MNNRDLKRKLAYIVISIIVGLLTLAFYQSFNPYSDLVITPELSSREKGLVRTRCGEEPEVRYFELEKFHLNHEYNAYYECSWLATAITYPMNKWFFNLRRAQELRERDEMRVLEIRSTCGLVHKQNIDAYESCVDLNKKKLGL